MLGHWLFNCIPPLGGWVLDQGEIYAHNFWLILALSVAIAIFALQYLISKE